MVVERGNAGALREPRRTLGLIGSQAVVVLRGHLLPAMTSFVTLTFLAAASTGGEFGLLVLTAALPVVALLSLALLSGPRFDPAHDLIIATRTSAGAVLFARTTLVLGVTVFLGLIASLGQALVGGAQFMALVLAWLGPTLVIAAGATFLAQHWRLAPVAVLTLIAWAGVVAWAYLELVGLAASSFTSSSLLRPEPVVVVVQLIVGALLFGSAWRLARVASGHEAMA